MSTKFQNTDIDFLKGVGPKRAELLRAELKIRTFDDLLNHFPFRYIDRTNFHSCRDVFEGASEVQLKGVITQIDEVGGPRKKRLVANFTDGTGSIDLVWFKGIKWVKKSLVQNKEMIVFGRPNRFGKRFNIAHPEVEEFGKSSGQDGALQPVYPSTEKLVKNGLNSKGIEKVIKNLIVQIPGKLEETLSKELVEKYHFPEREKAMIDVHQPRRKQDADQARLRFKFEELFFLQLQMAVQKIITNKKMSGWIFGEVGVHFNTFFKHALPFELTGAQKRVVKEIRRDLGSGNHMNRLLQGDVGSGKTLVALLSMLIGLDNGFQACLMAPTEILATQHYETIKELCEKIGIEIELLTGSTKTKDRKRIHESLLDGSLSILVGTHALIEDKVQFKNLGIAVIDEQHRFGVAQRAKLWRKNSKPPHVLVMTATPIPRTLAMSFYGDLDVSVIDEMPPGRKPIKTIHRFDKSRLQVFQFIEDEIKKGRQIYIVYPLIEESEKLDYKDLMDGFESISRRFPVPDYKISIVHGRMKPADKDYEMQQFASGKTNILVATTVIEVGVNVPNASVMVIESAEKFGLSQLHQLRGRVGRGSDQAYCVLMTSYKLTEDGKKRMETMVRTNDGFEISEVDLKMRGPGDVLGTQQSGVLDFKIADIVRDSQVLQLARQEAFDIVEKDPGLTNKQNLTIRTELSKQMRNRPNWSRIS